MPKSQEFDMSLTVKDEETGEVIPIGGLIYATLPLQPAFVNSGYYEMLSAKIWRHELTHWYDQEQKFLDKLSLEDEMLAGTLRVLLYATFVKQAEEMGRNELRNRSANKRFTGEYRKFERRYGQPPQYPHGNLSLVLPPSPDHYLQGVDSSSYFFWRMALSSAT